MTPLIHYSHHYFVDYGQGEPLEVRVPLLFSVKPAVCA